MSLNTENPLDTEEEEEIIFAPQRLADDRIACLERQITLLTNEVQTMRTQPPISPPLPPTPLPPSHQPPPPQPNLNLHAPPTFSGTPSEVLVFRLKVYEYLMENRNIYTTDSSQVMYAGSLLTGPAWEWYASLVDTITMWLPPHYTLATFFQALESFFGGGVALDSRERALDVLRQTGTVAEMATSFKNITNTFSPRWPDHPLIFLFSRKLKKSIRLQLTSDGSRSAIFEDYVSSAIAVELDQAAPSHQPNLPPEPNPNPTPGLGLLPPPAYMAPPLPGSDPKDVGGSLVRHTPLSAEERRRRKEGNLCIYCGFAGHTLPTCPRAAHGRKARETSQPAPLLPFYPFPVYAPPPFGGPPNTFPGS